MTFGEYLRKLRKDRKLTLQIVAKELEIDTSLLAKLERGKRFPSRQLINEFAAFYKCDEEDLYQRFLSDQIAYKILDEDTDLGILKVAEEKVKYLKNKNYGK